MALPVPPPDDGSSSHPIVVVGAGLAGCMCALLLGRKKRDKVILLERRPDFRIEAKAQDEGQPGSTGDGHLTDSQKRSINLALSYRGINALKEVGLWERVRDQYVIEMKGRLIHPLNSSGESIQPYPRPHNRTDETTLYSVSRTTLNQLLLDELDKLDNVEVRFNSGARSVSESGLVTIFEDKTREPQTLQAKFVVGADGVNSPVRSALLRRGRFNFSQSYIPSSYKEITFHPDPKTKTFSMKENYLHIWPRGKFMIIGLPNPDNTFTGTLFASTEGDSTSFAELDPVDPKNPTKAEVERIEAYFRTHFREVFPLVPNVVQQFVGNPTSPLREIRLDSFHYKDKICLIGDAAHALVPFYGQGMNCAFEDSVALSHLLDEHPDDVGKAFARFTETRQPAAEALLHLSMKNYLEMRDHTAKRWYVVKKAVDEILYSIFPSRWIPLYTMVSFTSIPYHEALEKSRRQDKLLSYGAILGGLSIAGLAAFRLLKLRAAGRI